MGRGSLGSHLKQLVRSRQPGSLNAQEESGSPPLPEPAGSSDPQILGPHFAKDKGDAAGDNSEISVDDQDDDPGNRRDSQLFVQEFAVAEDYADLDAY